MATANVTATRRRHIPPPVSALPEPAVLMLDDKGRRIVERAIRVLEESAVYRVEAVATPSSVRAYLILKFAGLEHEEFHALWLDAQNRVISFDRMFTGSLTQTSVYPREVVKAGLAHNAGAVIFAHNHPSGVLKPSPADELLTGALKAALAMVDIKVLDHFIVAGNAPPLSFAERGLL